MKQDASMVWMVMTTIATAVCVLSLSDVLRRIVSKRRFEKRISAYILEGQALLSQSAYTTDGLFAAMQTWTDTIALDIKRHEGKEETDLFLKHVDMKATLEQLGRGREDGLIKALIGQRLTRLEYLQKK